MSSAPYSLLWVFSSFDYGGAQARFIRLSSKLGNDYRHHIVALDGNYQALEWADPQACIDRLDVVAKPSSGLSLANIRAFRKLQRNLQPDLVLTSNWRAIEWCFANRGSLSAPHIHFEDGFGPEESHDKQKKRRKWARRIAFRAPYMRFVAPSKVLSNCFLEDWKVPRQHLHYIANGIDVAHFAQQPAREHKRAAPNIGTVSSLRKEKRVDRLIEAFSMLSVNKVGDLLIVGDGDELAYLQKLTRDLIISEKVKFFGRQRDVRPYLSQMDIFAIPSDTEQMPISLMEAMAASLPVVSTEVGDISSMLAQQQLPFLSRPSANPKELAQHMQQLLADKTLRIKLGRANANKARREFDEKNMIASYDRLFRQILQAKDAPG